MNSILPKDIKIFAVLPAANRFDAKLATSHREYSYFLPTFMLTPINKLNLESPPKPKVDEDADGEQVVTQISTGVKKIIRRACAEDDVDIYEKFLERDISHISPQMLD
jgi:tRNA U38,U39,U40 pseudouridine synthase TruA